MTSAYCVLLRLLRDRAIEIISRPCRQPPLIQPQYLRSRASQHDPHSSEDWLSVLVGAALIALVLAGSRLTNPLQVGLLVLIPLTAGAAMLGARLLRFLPGALLVSALAWLAQAIAALPAVSAWSLE